MSRSAHGPTKLQQACLDLNKAIDAFWNDHTYGLGLTGMGAFHMRKIVDAQVQCKTALGEEGAAP